MVGLAGTLAGLRARRTDQRGALRAQLARLSVRATPAEPLELRPFQRVGAAFLASRHAALLTDDPGLGKTPQALAALPLEAPVLVIAPAAATGVWLREQAAWRPDYRALVLQGRRSFRWPAPGQMVVTNYELLSDAPGAAPAGCVVIADEAHALKDAEARRTKRFRRVSAEALGARGRCYLLTATPLLNRPEELWAVLEAANLGSEAFGGWAGFVTAFRGRERRSGKYTWGTPDSAAVANALRRVSLGRARMEVLPELPVKTWSTVMVDIDDPTRALLDGIDMDEVLRVANAGTGFAQLSAARAALATAKIPALLEVVQDFEDRNEPLVVFSAHLRPLLRVGRRTGWATITGETSAERRAQIAEAFQAGRLRGVACAIRAGGVAITLTRAANVVFVDRSWTPAENTQAEDRCCRIGQSRGVNVLLLVADHPVDERVTEIQEAKQALIEASVDASRSKHVPLSAAGEALLASRRPRRAPGHEPAGARLERLVAEGRARGTASAAAVATLQNRAERAWALLIAS